MGVLKKIAEKLDGVADKKIADAVEKAGVPPKPEPSPTPKPNAKFVRGLGERIGFAGIVVLTVGAALLGSVSACKVPGQPEPRPPYTEDADKPDYTCGYDGNHRCPTTPPPIQASCDEPATWCHHNHDSEAIQR